MAYEQHHPLTLGDRINAFYHDMKVQLGILTIGAVLLAGDYAIQKGLDDQRMSDFSVNTGYVHELGGISRNEKKALMKAAKELYPDLVDQKLLRMRVSGLIGEYELVFPSVDQSGEYPGRMFTKIRSKAGIASEGYHLMVF